MKKIILFIVALAALAYGYQYYTGKNITTLPSEVVEKIRNNSPVPKER